MCAWGARWLEFEIARPSATTVLSTAWACAYVQVYGKPGASAGLSHHRLVHYANKSLAARGFRICRPKVAKRERSRCWGY